MSLRLLRDPPADTETPTSGKIPATLWTLPFRLLRITHALLLCLNSSHASGIYYFYYYSPRQVNKYIHLWYRYLIEK